MLEHYFEQIPESGRSKGAIAYLAAIDLIAEDNPEVARAIIQELKDQRGGLKLIASENYSSLAVQLAMGNLLTDKYAEGHPHHRFYAGCGNVDQVEELAVGRAKQLFGADHAYVQPHSGADANLVALWAFLVQRVENRELQRIGKKSIDELSSQEYEQVRQLMVSQKMMGMGLGSGGHLTHGYRRNISSKIIRSIPYEVDKQTGLLDYGALDKQVREERPSLLMAGYSAYARLLNFAKLREIADRVGATFVVDMAHFAGLVAGKVLQGEFDPIPFADMVTSTTHKTLRGPRGGFILCTTPFKEIVDKGCPLVLGGPLPHVIGAKAVAFAEAMTPTFQKYAAQIVANTKALCAQFSSLGAHLLTGGSDNHLLIIDVMRSFGLTGRQAEGALRQANLTVNRNAIPFDPMGPWYTSGIRLGTPALTTLGMKEEEMRQVGQIVFDLLKGTRPIKGAHTETERLSKVEIDTPVLRRVQLQVKELLTTFPLYPELVIE